MDKKMFLGYKRPNGRYGTRNLVAVISASDNANFVAQRIADLVKGVVPVMPGFGRGEIGPDLQQHIKTLSGLGLNPNVHSVIVVSLEPGIAHQVAEPMIKGGQTVEVVTIDECGGSMAATMAGVRIAQRMVIEASRQMRVEAPLSDLQLGLECGGSDPTSGIVTNPATGLLSDYLVSLGGTVVVSEVAEWIGAERALAAQAATPQVAKDILDAVQVAEDYAKSVGMDIASTNPAPDNIKGGLTTLEEKSLGAVKKGGHTPIRQLTRNAEWPSEKGLIFMEAPAPGVENITALAACGCQAIIFTTGKGNAVGNPVSPTVKVTGNPYTVEKVGENIDVDLSRAITGGVSLEDTADFLFDSLVEHLNGKYTTAEVLNDLVVSVTRQGFTV
ncbi:MAG: hydrolase [Clostridia bacterium]|nr:hydrolase [Clostridia bacterium]